MADGFYNLAGKTIQGYILSKYWTLDACSRGDHTCLTVLSALFLQNHQRPDFFGIFSFTQASSVAWGHRGNMLRYTTPLSFPLKGLKTEDTR